MDESRNVVNALAESTDPLVPEEDAAPGEASNENIISASTLLSAPKPRREHSARVLLCVLLCLGALACKFFYPAGSELLRHWIIGTGNERIQVAVSSFDEALQQGQPVEEAVTAFCQQILHETAS